MTIRTAVLGNREPGVTFPSPAGSRYDHIFFPAFAAAIAVAVFVGFSQTYFLSGLLKLPRWKAHLGPPHVLIVHIHAIVNSAWVILLVAQTSLARAGRMDLHRRLGLLGLAIACLVVAAGVVLVCEDLARLRVGSPAVGAVAGQVLRILGFGVLSGCGLGQRAHPAAHKRLMLIATLTLLPAALVRWPVVFVGEMSLALGAVAGMLGLVASYDLWSARKVHAATLWGSAVVILTWTWTWPRLPLEGTFIHSAVWLGIATHMQALGRFLR